MIKALLFDMDGLMIDSERLYFESEREIAREFNKPLNEKILWQIMGRKPIESINILIKALDLDIDSKTLLDIRTKKMEVKLKNDLKPMPGLFEILDKYYNKMLMAIVTSASYHFAEITVDTLNIRHYFNWIQSSEEIQKGKPDPEIYLKALAKLKLRPQDCVVLEDSENGCRAGKAAGCIVCAVPNEYSCEQDFSVADAIANDLIDASAIIENW